MATSKKVASHLTDIPDHLLAEIFLRLSAADDLARTSAACVSFRRLVTEASFLRRFRRLHAPPLLGFLDHDGFHPTQPPHPSAPAARALTLAADFSFSFLPSHCRWRFEDIRDGRVLLSGTTKGQERPVFKELVVCDPLHRRYILLPPVPDDLTASLQNLLPMMRKYWCTPFLVPLDKEETAAAEDRAFRVIWMAQCEINLSAFVFSSSTGQWHAATSKAWSDLVLGRPESDWMSKLNPIFRTRRYAYGCFYWDWLVINSRKLLVLDTRRMEFSMADLSPRDWILQGLAIVEAGEGRLGIFGFCRGTAADLSYTIARNKGESPSQCLMEKEISLGSRYKYFIGGAAERYLLLIRTEMSSLGTEMSSLGYPVPEYFSMDIKSLELQRVCANHNASVKINMYVKHDIYTNFPPSLLSSPTI